MRAVKAPETGIAFPLGNRAHSTTLFATAVLADAVRRYDADLAQVIEKCRDWRRGYPSAFRALTAVSASSPRAAVGIASEGLRSARSLLRFAVDGVETWLDAFDLESATNYYSAAKVKGKGTAPGVLQVPVDGQLLAGDALRRKLADWRARGIVEPSFVFAVEKVIDNPKWLALPGHQVVVVGADAELAPYEALTTWGADVFAIDLPGADRWRTLLGQAERGAGTVTYPTVDDVPGADVTLRFPELLAWIDANTSARKKLVFGVYASADGGEHIRVSAATDMMATGILDKRSNATLAYLGAPADCYAVKADVMAEARRRFRERGMTAPLEDALRFASRSALFEQNYTDEVVDVDGTHWGLANALVPMQGPDHALAHRLQRWRGVVTRAAGGKVSLTVAPASWTRSATKNRMLAAAYRGAGRFGVEIFAPDTARTLLAAKLVADIFAPNPVDPKANPEELCCEGAAHGGLWRQPFEPTSALGAAAASGLLRLRRR